MTSRQRKVFAGVVIGMLVTFAAVFALLQAAPGAGDAVDFVGTVLMVAGCVVLVGALLVMLRNRGT